MWLCAPPKRKRWKRASRKHKRERNKLVLSISLLCCGCVECEEGHSKNWCRILASGITMGTLGSYFLFLQLECGF